MKYYLDTEFNGLGGELISLALVRDDGESLYLINKDFTIASDLDWADRPFIEEWVLDNVIPILFKIPSPLPGMMHCVKLQEFPAFLEKFFENDSDINIVTDWPDDIKYMSECLITGPGEMINIPHISFFLARVDAYPTELPDSVQHNAWWDAKALKHLFDWEKRFYD